MAATTWNETKVQKLRDAITSGVMTVEYNGHRVTYQSAREMRETLAQAEAALNTSRPRYRVAVVNKGFSR